jgi:hypothetical protein
MNWINREDLSFAEEVLKVILGVLFFPTIAIGAILGFRICDGCGGLIHPFQRRVKSHYSGCYGTSRYIFHKECPKK